MRSQRDYKKGICGMNTFDTANTIRDLIDYYCMRCEVGLDNCKDGATANGYSDRANLMIMERSRKNDKE